MPPLGFSKYRPVNSGHCGDVIDVVDTHAELQSKFDAGSLAVIRSVADALIAMEADVVEV